MKTIVEGRGLGFAYADSGRWIFRDATFDVAEGEMLVVAGPSGGGKSTLLRCMNGLVPHFHGGRFEGRVMAGGIDTRWAQPRDLAHVAGMVFQDPEAQTVASTVEEEIAFGLENLGKQATVTRRRLEEALDALSIAHLRSRRLSTLSGGELQRVAIAAVLTMQPKVLLLDEPTSQLDPQAAADVLNFVAQLRSELGLTVVIAEHRLDRLAAYADRIMLVPGDGTVRAGGVRETLEALPGGPAVAAIGRALGWAPLPLSVGEARRFVNGTALSAEGVCNRRHGSAAGDVAVSVRGVTVTLDGHDALRGVTVDLHAGEIVALMGRNGAGKTTLLRTIAGLASPRRGEVGYARGEHPARDRYRTLALVAQDPASVLYHTMVEREIADVLHGTGRPGTVEEALDEWGLRDLRGANPADLSSGERQRVALAAMLAGDPAVVLLDEPTRGMDHATKELLLRNLRRRRDEGAAIVLASHDVELAAECASRVVLLAEGEVIADGPAADVLSESMTFTTQANKLLGGRVLTVDDALHAMGARA